mmetsp:Transcript_27338/g.54708  ORF Transcript_27338/g.54708 Transcript_27338/m.54708 type:complete len:280 (+) Transcript_27338:132-971(+)
MEFSPGRRRRDRVRGGTRRRERRRRQRRRRRRATARRLPAPHPASQGGDRGRRRRRRGLRLRDDARASRRAGPGGRPVAARRGAVGRTGRVRGDGAEAAPGLHRRRAAGVQKTGFSGRRQGHGAEHDRRERAEHPAGGGGSEDAGPDLRQHPSTEGHDGTGAAPRSRDSRPFPRDGCQGDGIRSHRAVIVSAQERSGGHCPIDPRYRYYDRWRCRRRRDPSEGAARWAVRHRPYDGNDRSGSAARPRVGGVRNGRTGRRHQDIDTAFGSLGPRRALQIG